MITFDRDVYFDEVRQKPFGGKLDQGQVDGQEAILERWEEKPLSDDLRHLAYALATTLHEAHSDRLYIRTSPDERVAVTVVGRSAVGPGLSDEDAVELWREIPHASDAD